MRRWRVDGTVTWSSAKAHKWVRLPYVPPETICADGGTVYTRDLKSLGLTALRVQIPLCAPNKIVLDQDYFYYQSIGSIIR